MKAVLLEQFGITNFHVKDIPTPAPTGNQVLVNIKAVSLNYLDLILANGSFTSQLPFPYLPASDGCGMVAAVGPEVTKWKVGDRVVIQYVQKWTKGAIDKESNSVRARRVSPH